MEAYFGFITEAIQLSFSSYKIDGRMPSRQSTGSWKNRYTSSNTCRRSFPRTKWCITTGSIIDIKGLSIPKKRSAGYSKTQRPQQVNSQASTEGIKNMEIQMGWTSTTKIWEYKISAKDQERPDSIIDLRHWCRRICIVPWNSILVIKFSDKHWWW